YPDAGHACGTWHPDTDIHPGYACGARNTGQAHYGPQRAFDNDRWPSNELVRRYRRPDEQRGVRHLMAAGFVTAACVYENVRRRRNADAYGDGLPSLYADRQFARCFGGG